MMNSLERVLTVIDHRIPDRVPVALHNFLTLGRFVGCSDLSELLRSGEFLAEGHIRAWKEIGHDLIQHENGVGAMAEALGCEVTYFKDEPPRVSHPVLENIEDVDRLSIPDPMKVFPLNEMCKATAILCKELGREVFINGRADQGPMALVAAIYGVEKLMIDLVTPEKEKEVFRLLDFCCKVTSRYALAHKEAGAHGTCIGGYGLSLISPRTYKKFEFPFEKKFLEGVKKSGLKAFLHICGKEDAILKYMVHTKADVLELDPLTDMKLAKKAVAGKATLCGFIDPANIMGRSDYHVVKLKAKEAIEILGQKGGFILAPGCALPIGTPTENMIALMDVVKEQI